MAYDLVKRLRTCSSQERRAVALALAQTGTDDAVRELIRMVEGSRRHWLSWYNLDDQLIGVEALGTTGNRRALDYLKKVYTTIAKTTKNEIEVYATGSEPMDDDVYSISFEEYNYPRARRSLAGSLSHRRVVYVAEEVYSGEFRELPEDKWQPVLPCKTPERMRAHQVFRGAIARLKIDLYEKRLLERDISTYDVTILEGKLGLYNEKFNPSGNARPFYGLTCIAWVDQKSELFQELCSIQSTLSEKLQEAGLGNIFTFLKPESFHMTICDINASPDPSRCFDRRIIEPIQSAFNRIEIQGKVLSQIRGIGLKRTITALVRFNSESELERVYDIEREIKESILQIDPEIKRSACVSVRDFVGHISLAYFVQHPGDNIETIKNILLPYRETAFGEFSFSQFDLTYFTDMNTYIPILTINLKDGKVTHHDSNLKMLMSKGRLTTACTRPG